MESKGNSLVSIIIPVYNRVELLPRTLKSVVNQTYENLEIIVVDDASSEDVKSVIDSFNDPRIKYIRHDENRGPAAKNTGLKVAKGDFIAFLDSDDEYLPKKIEKQVEFFKENKDIEVVFCRMLRQRNGVYRLKKKITNVLGFVFLQQIMIRKEVIEKVGLLDENYIFMWDDVDYVYRLRKLFKFGFIEEPLVIFNDTPGSLGKKIEIKEKLREIFIEKHLDTLTRKQLTKLFYDSGKDYIYLGQVREGMRNFFRAYLVYPLNQKALKKIIRYAPLLFFYILKTRR